MIRCRSLAEIPVRRVEISKTARNHILSGFRRLLQQRARRQARLMSAVRALERGAVADRPDPRALASRAGRFAAPARH